MPRSGLLLVRRAGGPRRAAQRGGGHEVRMSWDPCNFRSPALRVAGLLVATLAWAGCPGDFFVNGFVVLEGPSSGPAITVAGTVMLTVQTNRLVAEQGVERIVFFRNEEQVCVDDAPPFECAWNVTAASNGAHKWHAYAHVANNAVRSNPLDLQVAIGGFRSLPRPLSLGDLLVPTEFVAEADGFSRWFSQQDNPAIAQAWQTVDATSAAAVTSATGGHCSPITANDGGDDSGNLQCIVDRVPPKTVVRLPQGNYDLANQRAVQIRRDAVVLSGEGAGRTVIRADGLGVNQSSPGPFGCDSKEKISIEGGSLGDAQTWTSGYTAGTNVIGVADASAFSVGGWVRLKIDEDCERVPCQAGRSCSCSASSNNQNFQRFAKVAAIDVTSNTLTIEIPLRVDYRDHNANAEVVGSPQNPTATPATMVEFVGIEGITFEMTNQPATSNDFRNVICTAMMAESWITNIEIKNAHANMITLLRSPRNFIAHNLLDGQTATSPDLGMGVINIKKQSQNNHVHDNLCLRSQDCVYIQQASHGTIASYNHFAEGRLRDQVGLLHGEWVSVVLWEGNTGVGHLTIADDTWGPAGRHNVFYRNRLLGEGGPRDHHLGVFTHLGHFAGRVSSFETAVLLNTGFAFAGTIGCGDPRDGWCPGLDSSFHESPELVDLWVERNRWRDTTTTTNSYGKYGLVLGPGSSGDAPSTTACGGVPGDCPPEPGRQDVIGLNYEGPTSVPEPLQTADVPFSLVREWHSGADIPGWCAEYNQTARPIVGAEVDVYPLNDLQKTPAHRRYEGLDCTR